MEPTKLACVALLLTLLVAAPVPSKSMGCGQVVTSMLPCLNYLRNGGAVPGPCCNGARSLDEAAKSTKDRQEACACLKQAAKSYAINYKYGMQLADKCGIHLDVKITPDIDCSKVH